MEHLCLLLVFIPASLSLQCWNQNTDQGSLYLQMCTTNQTSCVASYHVEGDITTATYFACSSPASSRSCLHQECNPMGASGNIYSCCCRGDLCNTVPGLTPNMVVPSSVPSTSPSGPVPTVEDEPDECARFGCSNSCIIYNGNVTCLCGAGYSLSQDGRTCEDINECLFSPCGEICVNTEGSFHCECPLWQRLGDDGFTCEETGLVCQYQQCNSASCPEPSIHYCDDENTERSHQICQATYTRVGDGSFRPGLLSCFSGSHGCSTDKCVFRQLETYGNTDIYFCCCTENLCNAQIVFPNETGTVPPSAPTSAPTSVSVPLTPSVQQTESLPPTSSIVPNGATKGPETEETGAISTAQTTQYDNTWMIVGTVSSFIGGVVLGIVLTVVFYNRKNFYCRPSYKSNTSASHDSKQKEFNLENNAPIHTSIKHHQFQYHHL